MKKATKTVRFAMEPAEKQDSRTRFASEPQVDVSRAGIERVRVLDPFNRKVCFARAF